MRSMINQIQIEDYRNERIDIHYRRGCEIKIDKLKDNFNKMSIEIEKKEKELRQREQAANLKSTIPLNEIISQLPLSIAITTVLPTMEPEDSLIMGDENLSTIPEKELDEFIKSSVEDLFLILSESEDTSDNDITYLSELNEDECFDPGGNEIEACLTSDSIPPGIDGAEFDPEGDILLLKKLLNDDISFSLPLKELYF
ncbi:hypothetical protein Tco_0633791 [Tanacetum coccineum]